MKTSISSSDSLLAVVESTSPLEVILTAIPQTEVHLAVTVTPADRSPQGFSWYEVRSTNGNRVAAMASIRQALASLISGGESGRLSEFRVVHGAAFIANRGEIPAPNIPLPFDDIGLPA